MKKKSVPQEYREKIKQLDDKTLNILATDIFEIETLEDLNKYLNVIL